MYDVVARAIAIVQNLENCANYENKTQKNPQYSPILLPLPILISDESIFYLLSYVSIHQTVTKKV